MTRLEWSSVFQQETVYLSVLYCGEDSDGIEVLTQGVYRRSSDILLSRANAYCIVVMRMMSETGRKISFWDIRWLIV